MKGRHVLIKLRSNLFAECSSRIYGPNGSSVRWVHGSSFLMKEKKGAPAKAGAKGKGASKSEDGAPGKGSGMERRGQGPGRAVAFDAKGLVRNYGPGPVEIVEEPSLFASTMDISKLKKADINKYISLRKEDITQYLAEGLPSGASKEFDLTGNSSILVRSQALSLCNRMQFTLTGKLAYNMSNVFPVNALWKEDPKLEASEDGVDSPPTREITKEKLAEVIQPCRHYLLDGPVGSGKSLALAMIVLWARSQGWLVFYEPRGKMWTHENIFSFNELTGFWDTPWQAESALQGFLLSHSELLGQIKCRVSKPIILGEATMRDRKVGAQEVNLPEGSTLKDLVDYGISVPYASSSVVARLSEELSLVKEVPVLIAIDQYNSWFTFSQYHQYMGPGKRRPIHAKELTMVNAFRPMERGSSFYIGAFSHSTAVGKLPLQLPGVPPNARFNFTRFDQEEAAAVLNYYHKMKVLPVEPTEDSLSRLFFLTNGNGREIRTLARFL